MDNGLSLLTVAYNNEHPHLWDLGKDGKWLIVSPAEYYFLSQVHKIISVRGAQHVEIDIVSFVFGITCRRVF